MLWSEKIKWSRNQGVALRVEIASGIKGSLC